jgi:hypothetical protein
MRNSLLVSSFSAFLCLSGCAHSAGIHAERDQSGPGSVQSTVKIAIPTNSAFQNPRLVLAVPGLTGETPIQIHSSSNVSDAQLSLEVVSDSRAEAEAFQKDLTVTQEDRSIELTFKPGAEHSCDTEPLRGSCVRAATLTLPSKTGLRVIAGNTMLYGQMELDDLLLGLAKMDDGGRLETLQRYLADRSESRFITIAEASHILCSFQYDSGKIAAARMLSDRITDPQNAGHVMGAAGSRNQTQPTIIALLGHGERAPAAKH